MGGRPPLNVLSPCLFGLFLRPSDLVGGFFGYHCTVIAELHERLIPSRFWSVLAWCRLYGHLYHSRPFSCLVCGSPSRSWNVPVPAFRLQMSSVQVIATRISKATSHLPSAPSKNVVIEKAKTHGALSHSS
jgi:hypothetical protein